MNLAVACYCCLIYSFNHNTIIKNKKKKKKKKLFTIENKVILSFIFRKKKLIHFLYFENIQ